MSSVVRHERGPRAYSARVSPAERGNLSAFKTQLFLIEDAEPYPPERLRDLLHRGSLAAHRYRAVLARRLGLGDTESAALAHLARSGPLTPRQLGRLLFLTSGGVTALLHRLERAGHVTREAHPTDRRSSVLRATPAILQRGDELGEPLAQALDAVSARRSPQEREAIGRYLEEVLEVMAAHAPDEPAERDDEQAATPARVHPGLWA